MKFQRLFAAFPFLFIFMLIYEQFSLFYVLLLLATQFLSLLGFPQPSFLLLFFPNSVPFSWHAICLQFHLNF